MADIITLSNKYIEYYLGYRCNLDCAYCDVDKSKVSQTNGIEKFESIVANYKNFVENKLTKIILSGGEPTLFRKEVLEILEKYSNKYIFHIISNGKEIDTLMEYCKYPIEVTISYDGHNNDRGFDAFESLKKVHSVGRLKGVNITISNSNYADLYETCCEVLDVCPELISDELLSNNLTGLKIEIVRQKKEFYKFDYEKFREQLDLVYRKISRNLHIFHKTTNFCNNFWEYENHLICDHGTGYVKGSGCFQNLLNPKDVIDNYERNCKRCKNTGCYAYNCPVTYEMIGSYDNHPYCDLNTILREVEEKGDREMFLEKELKGTNYVELILTDSCNMNCKHCFEKPAEGESRNPLVMSNEVIDSIFERVIKDNPSNLITFNLFGGEPIMSTTLDVRRYLLKKIKESGKRIEISVVSNTYQITDEDIEWIKEAKEVTCHFSWQVSLDSVKEYNDKGRITCSGAGTFDKVMENLKRISPIIGKDKININSVITFENIGGLIEWCKYLSKNILFKYADHVSFRNDQSRMHELTLMEKCILSETFNNLAMEYLNGNEIAPEIIRSVFRINSSSYLYRDKETERMLSCGICNSQISISANGNILPCHYLFTDEIVFGNILDPNNVSETIKEDYTLLRINTPHISGSTGESCDKCEFRFNCIRCKLEQYRHGDINKTSAFNCEWVKQTGKIFDKYLWDRFRPFSREEIEEYKLDVANIQLMFEGLDESSSEYNEILKLIDQMYTLRRERIW